MNISIFCAARDLSSLPIGLERFEDFQRKRNIRMYYSKVRNELFSICLQE